MLEWTVSKFNTKSNLNLLLVNFCFFVFLLFCFFVVAPQATFAQSQDAFGLDQVGETIQLGGEDIRVIVAKIIRAVLGLLGIIAIVINLYAGYTIMTSGGNEEKVSKGKKILTNGIIGLAIILSSFAITQFVLTRLAGATGFDGATGPGGIVAPPPNTFSGSGALGSAIPDHYPFRDQREVPRNTKITVTFRLPVDPTSFIVDTNTNGTFGDCINTNLPTFNWNTDCDRVDTNAVNVVLSATPATGDPAPAPLEMAALATREGAAAEIFTVVFRPLDLIGNENDTDVGYRVTLGTGILNADGSQVFGQFLGGRYIWEFFASNVLDLTAPRVDYVFPAANQTIPRNSIIQIQFSEPVDPTVVQGLAGVGSPFYHIIFGDTALTGEWRVSNGYRTVEFVSDQACGSNSCGDIMYCLQSACPTGDQACVDNRRVLIRTGGLLLPNSTFEAVPFSGVMDLAGNALDGNANALPDGKPALPANFQEIRVAPNGTAPFEDEPDNYIWNFQVQNTIDRGAPFVETMTPGIDAEDVLANALHEITFNRIMWASTLTNIGIVEHGLPALVAGADPVDPIWFVPRSRVENNQTIVRMDHRVFGPNDQSAFYFTSIGSQVRSTNQNCLYPGRGPVGAANTEPTCIYEEDVNGVVITNTNCADVNFQATTDTACVQAAAPGQILQPDATTCIENLRILSPTI
jgi:hypothetical protein